MARAYAARRPLAFSRSKSDKRPAEFISKIWNNVTKRLFSYIFPWFGYINKDGQEPNLLHVGSLR